MRTDTTRLSKPSRSTPGSPTRRAGAVAFALVFAGSTASAQLADESQIHPSVPGGAIAKSLEEQVGAGRGDAYTPYSSVYLIKRDPARSIRRGRQLFQRKFTAEQGVGPRVSDSSSGNIREMRALGAGLADSCAACHGRPRGAAGFGGDVATRPDSRDAPHLFGLGLQEMLADEITRDLRAIRDDAIARATSGGSSSLSNDGDFRTRRSGKRSRTRDGRTSTGCWRWQSDCDERAGSQSDSGASAVSERLVSKGIDFGRITAFPDGTVDLSQVEGVDEDLRVRPFFHHGETVSMREFIVGALKAEMGLEAADPVLCAATDPDAPTAQESPSGFVFDPAEDSFERPPVCDLLADGDGDGVRNEVDPALIDHFEFYLLNYFRPGTGRTTARTEEGLALLESSGCTSCHVQNLVIERDRRVADVDTAYDPERGFFNRLFATAEPKFEIVVDGEPNPQLLPLGDSFVVQNIFTDFKRHDLGEAFHEREYDGTLQTEMLTEALWGVGSTSPYGHDGRSINLHEVILRHGGEALASRQAYERLSDNDQRKIGEFLQTLILFPPDDTASNLNPGDPAGHIQDPSAHGTINLGALFQLDYEGPE